MKEVKIMERVTFADIAGYEDEKKQAMKIVNWLKNYDKLCLEGVYLSKGLLLCGEPGVGKTMFAKAIATESGVHFVNAKLYGAIGVKDTISQIQKAFIEAKNNIPSILLLDEIDQLIGGRNASDSDERHKLIDFLLQELDGSENSEGVLVIGTCNNWMNLPSAFLRSGRMDQHIQFLFPDLENREKILHLYLSKNKRFDKVNVHDLAISTDGLQCADLKSLVNNVLLKAIDENKEYVQLSDFNSNINSIITKDVERKVKKDKLNPQIAYHELGHLAVNYYYGRRLNSINIVGSSGKAGHVRNYNPTTRTFKYSIESFDCCLGGKVGVKIFCDEIDVGCASDLRKASLIYQNLSQNYGSFGYDALEIWEPNNVNETSIKSNEFRVRREGNQVKFFEEREKVVEGIIKKERELIEFLYPILMKKGVLSIKSLQYYVNKFTKKQGAKLS